MRLEINTNGQTVTLPRRDVEIMEKYLGHLNNLFSVTDLEGKLVSAVTQTTYSGGMLGGLDIHLAINLNGKELKNMCIDEATKSNLFSEIANEIYNPNITERDITRGLENADINSIVLWENGKPIVFRRTT